MSEVDITEQFDSQSTIAGSDSGHDMSAESSEKTTVAPPRVCRYYIQGKCNKGASCTFSHDTNAPSESESASVKIPCRNMINTGHCTWGAACRFDHSVQTQVQPMLSSHPPACAFFAQGKCTKGQACPFSHAQGGIVGYMSPGSGAPQFGMFIPLQPTLMPMLSLPPSVQVLPTQVQQLPPNNPPKSRACRFYAAGNCQHGDSCRFSHDDPLPQASIEEAEQELNYDFDNNDDSGWGTATTWDNNPQSLQEAESSAGQGWPAQSDEQDPNTGVEEANDWGALDEGDKPDSAIIDDGNNGWDIPNTHWDEEGPLDDPPKLVETNTEETKSSATATWPDDSQENAEQENNEQGNDNWLPLNEDGTSTPNSRSRRSCLYFAQGHCQNGSRCRFIHGKPEASANKNRQLPPHMEDKSKETCRHYLAGACSQDDCRFLHSLEGDAITLTASPRTVDEVVETWRSDVTPPSPTDAVPLPERDLLLSSPPPDVDITFEDELHGPPSFERRINYCGVTLGAGCAIQSLATSFESATIHISKLSGSSASSALQQLIKTTIPKARLIDINMGGIVGQAKVTFAHFSQAAMAARVMNGAIINNRPISACLSTQAGMMSYHQDATIRLTYKAPELQCFVYFPNVEKARATSRLEKFRDGRLVDFRDYSITVHYESPGKRMSPAQRWQLSVNGLRVDSKGDVDGLKKDLMELFVPYNATSVLIGTPSYEPDQPGRQIPFLLAQRIGELEDFELLRPIKSQPSERQTAFAIFATRGDATRAVQELDRYKDSQFLDSSIKTNILRVFPSILTKYRIPFQQFRVLEHHLAAFNQPLDNGGKERSVIRITLDNRGRDEDSRVRLVYLSTDNISEAVKLNRKLSSLLAGEVVQDSKGQNLWSNAFVSEKGTAFFSSLNHENPETYVQCDQPGRCIRLFGEDEALEPLRQTMARLAAKLDKIHISLTSAQVDLLLAGGLDELQLKVGEKVPLDVYGKRLVAPFDFDSSGGSTIDEKITNFLSSLLSERDVVSTARHCLLCSSTTGPLFTLSQCDHRFHQSCLKYTILSTIHAERVDTIKCPAHVSSAGSTICGTLISTKVIHHLLDEQEQTLLFTGCVLSHLRSNPSTFKTCPTYGCPNVYRVPEEDDWVMRRCPICWIPFCASCGVRYHDGYNCGVYQAKVAQIM